VNPVLLDLITLLRLERIEDNIFRGQSRDIGSAQVFGGQVVGQALSAAHLTVESRRAHSLHAYFLRHGRPILNLAASFQSPEAGLEHRAAMPVVPGPEGLQDATEVPDDVLERIPEKMRRYLTHKRPFEFRPVRPPNFTEPEVLPPVKHVWIRAVDALPDDATLHQNLLAYVSDYELLGTSALPHGLLFARGNVLMASLDHALWFHRDVRMDDWLLYTFDSPNASGARGFARGQFFTRNGVLVASSAQEGLVRVLPEGQTRMTRSEPRLQR